MAVRPLSNAQLAAVLCLDRNITQWNLQRSGYTFTIGRIGFVAIADVADLDFTRRTTYGACRVFKQHVLLLPESSGGTTHRAASSNLCQRDGSSDPQHRIG